MDQSQLKKVIHYDPESGMFRWLVSRGRVKAGSYAGRICRQGYVQIQVFGKLYSAHRLAWLYVYGSWPLNQIDHIDRVKSNNRINNLRGCSNSENGQNQDSSKGSSSRFVGVNWNKSRNKWVASLTIGGSKKHLGLFDNEIDAAAAYLDEKKRTHKFNPVLIKSESQ